MVAPEALLAQVWRSLGGDARAPERVAFSGEPALASRFEVSALAAATSGAAALAAAELWAARGAGERQVLVDHRLADAAFACERLFAPQGWELARVRDPLTGDYRAADGWIRLHMNYSYHRDAALSVLGASRDPAHVRDAVAKHAAQALESTIVERGGCAAVLRTRESWAAHPQGAAIAAEPLVHREGRGEPRRGAAPAAPLAGLRVLDMTRVIAGPVGTRFLAAMGAEVLRIDPPGFAEVPALLPETTRGKRCAFLDLKDDRGRAAFDALVRGADALVHGYRPGAMERLGYPLERLRELNPRLVVVRYDAYGWSGPWRERRGYDSLVQMSSGIAHPDGDGKPTPLPVQALDHATGYLVAAATCRALADGCALSRLSLARTARLLVDLGLGGDARAPGFGDASNVLEDSRTEWGPARQVPCPGRIEGYEARWALPSGPLGRDPAAWS
ncbi:MAG TPA: CoA transferase [Usitatibacter sp.]|nr:CoA transferase [Usitatibacter sp.]